MLAIPAKIKLWEKYFHGPKFPLPIGNKPVIPVKQAGNMIGRTGKITSVFSRDG